MSYLYAGSQLTPDEVAQLEVLFPPGQPVTPVHANG
jgi:hypothetical protein